MVSPEKAVDASQKYRELYYSEGLLLPEADVWRLLFKSYGSGIDDAIRSAEVDSLWGGVEEVKGEERNVANYSRESGIGYSANYFEYLKQKAVSVNDDIDSGRRIPEEYLDKLDMDKYWEPRKPYLDKLASCFMTLQNADEVMMAIKGFLKGPNGSPGKLTPRIKHKIEVILTQFLESALIYSGMTDEIDAKDFSKTWVSREMAPYLAESSAN